MSQPREPIVKSIIKITPDDLAGATSLYEVRPNVEANYGGWTKIHFTPELTINITERKDWKPLPNILNDSIKLNVQSSPWSDPHPASVYYVINAANQDAAVKLIQQYAHSHPFPEKFAIDIIKSHIRDIVALQQQHLTKSESGGRRKMKRRQIKKMKTKRRQIKKRKTTSKKTI
jgi:hypothetical protein